MVVATCRKPSDQLLALGVEQIIEGIDVTIDSTMDKLVNEITEPVDIVINNAGYFMKEKETVQNNFNCVNDGEIFKS